MFSILAFTALLAVGKSAAIQISVDYSAAPDLKSFADRVTKTLTDWYPRLEKGLRSPTFKKIDRVSITFDPKYKGVAYADASAKKIVGAVDYYRSHQDDVGSMIHELVHIIQGYEKCPGWLTEGIADYWRYYQYEPDRKPQKPGTNAKYTDGYGTTAYFLNYIVKKNNFSPDMVYWLNKDCREGTYNDNIWPKMLGGKTVDQLWQEMMKDPIVKVDVDYSAAPDLKCFADKVKATLTAWYPYFAQAMQSPTFKHIENIKVTFDPNYDGVAYAVGNQIVGSAKYYRCHQDDIGSMIHEMIHVIQGYVVGPSWLTEGIADYWRYYHFEPNRQPKKPGPNNKVTDGYGVTAYFINYIQKTYGNLLFWINKDAREGKDPANIWPGMLAGRTLDFLWKEMMARG